MATATDWRKQGPPGEPRKRQSARRKPAGKRAAPRHRSGWRWLAAAVLLLVLLWLLPTLVAKTPLRNWALRSAVADLKGDVTARSASLGWFSLPKLSGLEIRDEQGQTVLEIPEIGTDRSLLSLLWDYSRLGRIRLQRPTLNVVLREEGSNVEDVLASYLAPSDQPWKPVDVGLEIVDGKVSISDPRTGQAWQIDGFQLSLVMPADQTKPLGLKTSGTVTDPQRPGSFSAEMKMHPGGAGGPASAPAMPDNHSPNDPPPAGRSQLLIATEDLPLPMFQAILDRFGVKMQAAGRLSSAVQCHWNNENAPGQIAVQGTTTGDGLVLTAPSLGSDQLALGRVHATYQLAWQGDRVEVGSLIVESDVGSASLKGSVDLDDEKLGNLLTWLPEQMFELDARLDLARLAAVLPDTLRIRQGTRVTSGQLQVAAGARRGPEGMSWQGQMQAANLVAVNQGRRIAWRQPILVSLAAHQSPQGPIVESLRCDSDFLKLHAAGTPEQLTGSATFDLTRLAEQFGELVDFGGVHLSGDGWAQLHWQRSDARDFAADGEIQLRSFELAIPERPTWTEENLTVTLSATGRSDSRADTRVDTAMLRIDVGADWLQARLTQPVLDLRGGGDWPVEIRAAGELARFAPRVSPWVILNDWRLSGSFELLAQGTGSAAAVDVRQGRFAVTQLQVQGPGVDIREPQAELIVSGRWDGDQRRLQVPSASLTSDTVSAQAADVVCTLIEGGLPELAGTVAFRGSLDRLSRPKREAAESPPWHVLGQFAGKAQFRHAGGATSATFDTTINDLVATHQSGRQFHEAQIRLSGQGTYDAQKGLIQLDQARLGCGTLGFQTAGRIAVEQEQTALQLTGQLDYDMEKLSELLSAYLGQEVRFAGRGSRPVTLEGPLALDALQARAGLSWTAGDVYGFRLGPAELAATLSGGMVQIQPMDLPLSEGQLRLASQVRLAPEPQELYVQPGRIAEQVRINPRMCANALQYIAPVLAGVATAEGRFSIELDGCRIPLGDPAQGELVGRMILHSAQIGPGPLVQELAVLLGRATPAQLRREAVIPFRMSQGRVYHRDLELVFPDLTIRTHGSVGLDQSLEIMAEMPIPPKWRASHQMLDLALQDQIIRVPIAGTLSKPKIDSRTLEQLSQQFLENAARNVLERGLNEGINRGLDQLFRPAP